MTRQADRPDGRTSSPSWRDVLALRAEHGADAPLDRGEVRHPAGRRRGEPAGADGRLMPRRDDRDLPHRYYRPGRPPRPGHVSQRPPATRPTALGCVAASNLADGPSVRLLPDHPRLGHPAPALRLQALRAQDLSRPWTRSPPSWAAIGASYGGAHRPDRHTRVPGRMALKAEMLGLAVMVELPLVVSERPAGRTLDRHAYEDVAGRFSSRRSTGAMASRRSRSWRRPRRPSASTWRSRRGGSRCGT